MNGPDQLQAPAPHQLFASFTHVPSHFVLQQYGSLAQTVVAHELQFAASLTPVVQTLCAQGAG